MAHLFHRNPAATARTPKPLVALALTALSLGLSSCGAFFQCEGKASCPATTTGSSTTDYAYVTNSASGSTYLNGYVLTSGTPVAATSSPTSLKYTPQALVVTIPDTFLYVASDSGLLNGVGNVYGYSIGTGGALTGLSSGSALAAENSVAMDVSPDGKYLFSLNLSTLTVDPYTINTSTGLLGTAGTYPLGGGSNGGTVVPNSLKFAPSGNFFVATYGTGGAQVFAYNSSTGAISNGSSITPASTSIGFYGVAIDSNNYIYLASTNGLQVFSATTAGITTALKTYPIGNGPSSVVVSSDNAYVYVANSTDSTITGYSIGSNGVLTAISGSPFTAPTEIRTIGRDNSGKYLITVGYNANSGIQTFVIGSGGVLTLSGSAATGTSTVYPATLAVGH